MQEKVLVCKSVKTKAAALFAAVVIAIGLPQFFHLLGRATGTGSVISEIFLPMHIAVFAAGFVAGPVAGLAAGVASPLLSHAICGMPSSLVLPFMTAELGGYGLAAGLLAKTRLSPFVQLMLAQIAGRVLRAIAVFVAAYGFGAGLPLSSIWTSVLVALPGIALQWCIAAVVVGKVRAHDKQSLF